MNELVTQEPLRLMIYDRTDVKRSMQNVIGDLDVDIPIGLTHSWVAGGRLYKALRWVDECQGFDKWETALHWLATFKSPSPIRQIQIWGHGSPGKSWMSGESLTYRSVTRPDVQKIAERMTDDGVIWFRNCSVFCGLKGKEFAKSWANELGCRIAAHTYVIGPLQSGLHSLGPGEEPDWPDGEGINEGTPGKVLSCRSSMPWSPNTVFMLKSKVPEGW